MATEEDPKELCYFCDQYTTYRCTSAREAWTICGKEEAEKDPAVYEPHHYAKWKVEPITFILQNDLPYGVGNVIKYVMRYKDKNGKQDLLKAKRYIDLIIENEYPE